MFVYSVKASKKRLLIIIAAVLIVVAGAVFLFKNLSNTAAKTPDVNVNAQSNEERIAFLSQYGWQVLADPIEVEEVAIPSEFDEVYSAYNEIQTKQNFDLTSYAGDRVKRWTYMITNYPGYESDSGLIHANLLISDGKVVGGDIMSIELNGFMHGFQREISEAESATEPESASVSESAAQTLATQENTQEKE